MYECFKLKLEDDIKNNLKDYYAVGQDHYFEQKKEIRTTLDSYIGFDGRISANKVMEDWFPSVDADIFLSHSHKDESLAISLSGWIKKRFGLSVFIDSCVWGYSDDLLREIDDRYCLNDHGGTYNYTKRNYSTTHVHMMLSTALSKMIDKSEAIFFLNTPNSLNAEDSIIGTESTGSAWIYSEISSTKIIRKRSLDEHRGLKKQAFAKSEIRNESLEISYELDFDHFKNLSSSELGQWNSIEGYEYPLDFLYKLKR